MTSEVAKKGTTTERILSSASSLFAKSGYQGVSTREIAEAAGLNEVTIYRHYPRKRDLYLAALDSELSQISLKGELLSSIAAAPDARSLLLRTFRTIEACFAHKPELVRLLHHIALDLDSDLEVLLCRHVGELIDVIAFYLDQWANGGKFVGVQSKPLVLALIAVALNQGFLTRVFSVDEVDRVGMVDAWGAVMFPETKILQDS